MKNLLLALFVAAFMVPACLAEDGNDTSVPNPLADSLASLSADTTFTGKIYSVSRGNSISGISPQLTFKDDSGQETVYIVPANVTVTGKDGRPTTFNWVSRDDKVSIEFTEQDGNKTIRSIKVLSDW